MRKKTVIGILLIFVLFSPGLLLSFKGGIKGKTVDSEANPLAGVAVIIISEDHPSAIYKTMTNKKGEFIQVGLDPGLYKVRCEKETYQPSEALVKVLINEIAEKDFIMSSVVEVRQVEEVKGKKELSKANKLFQDGKYDEALAAYQEAAVLAPEDAVVQHNIGVTYMALGLFPEAIMAFKRTVAIQPENSHALKNLGQIYGKMKSFDESVKFYSQAALFSSADPEVFFNLGVAHVNLGNLDAAQEAFQKTIACDENNADAHYQLGMIFLNRNELDRASAALEQFLALAPEDSRAPNVREIIKITKKK